MRLVEILIEYASHTLDRPFSYIYQGSKILDRGFRVLLPFNHQQLVGYVLSVRHTDKTKEQLQDEHGFVFEEIIDVLDESPLLNDDLFVLADKIHEHYLAPKISVLQAMLPPSLSPRRSSLKAPKIAYDQYVVLKDHNEEGLSAKQVELLRFIGSETIVLKNEIASKSVLKKLLLSGHVEIIKKEKRRLKIPQYDFLKIPELTTNQKRVINEFNESNAKVFLLEGVTGSGKTEVYLSLSQKTIDEGKSVLMLVPEISLTPMMMEYFIRRFNNKVAILHSELTPSEKYDEYRKIARGDCSIVIGARSAIFAPLRNIGLIILDEEHVETYKQDTLPFYHARDVAIMRGQMHNAKVLLGSATPSLETKARAQKKVYEHLCLSERINQKELPQTTIVNLTDYSNIDRDSYIFSLTLRKAIKETLDKKEQVILLLNRRGYSTNITCRKCGHHFKCPICGIPLTYHAKDNMLKCHHCDHVEVFPTFCPSCGDTYLMKTGFGTEKIEEEVHKLFKDAKCLRLDSDVSKAKSKIPSIIESFRQKQADILIGTQMIAKGHDFPNVTLVGIVLADIGLSMPSFRSAERVFQLITQAVGRSGRSDKIGKAIIQTYNPSHYAITLGARQNYALFYRKEMSMRKLQGYPPYTFLISITLSSKDEDKLINESFNAAQLLRDDLGNNSSILGPSTPYVSKNSTHFFRTILIKYKDFSLIKSTLKKLIKVYSHQSSINLSINVDPYDF